MVREAFLVVRLAELGGRRVPRHLEDGFVEARALAVGLGYDGLGRHDVCQQCWNVVESVYLPKYTSKVEYGLGTNIYVNNRYSKYVNR